MIYEVREIKSFNDVINSDVRTSLLSSVLFCYNTPPPQLYVYENKFNLSWVKAQNLWAKMKILNSGSGDISQ